MSFPEGARPIKLSVGTIHKINDEFYVHGSKRLNENSVSETFQGEYEDYKIIGEDENGNIVKGEIVKTPYEWTEYITPVFADDVINYLIEDIKNTSLEISNANIFLSGDPIKAKGLMSVYLHDCFFYKDETGTFVEMGNGELKGSFVELKNGVFNAQIGNNVFNGNPKREFWPEKQEFFLKVSKQDNVINSYTDKRGYIPTSCGKENAEKNVTIIVRGSEE